MFNTAALVHSNDDLKSSSMERASSFSLALSITVGHGTSAWVLFVGFN